MNDFLDYSAQQLIGMRLTIYVIRNWAYLRDHRYILMVKGNKLHEAIGEKYFGAMVLVGFSFDTMHLKICPMIIMIVNVILHCLKN